MIAVGGSSQYNNSVLCRETVFALTLLILLVPAVLCELIDIEGVLIMSNEASNISSTNTWHNTSTEDDDFYPGIVFVIYPASQVHAALALPSVANIRPPLQQGGNEEQSVANLYRWLDNVATQLGLNHSFATAFNGNRIPGVYHHLSKVEEQRFRMFLGSICNQWHFECMQGDISAGFVVEISVGAGTAKGMFSAASLGLGPFICLQ